MTRQPNDRFILAAIHRIQGRCFTAGLEQKAFQDVCSELEAIGNELRLPNQTLTLPSGPPPYNPIDALREKPVYMNDAEKAPGRSQHD